MAGERVDVQAPYWVKSDWSVVDDDGNTLGHIALREVRLTELVIEDRASGRVVVNGARVVHGAPVGPDGNVYELTFVHPTVMWLESDDPSYKVVVEDGFVRRASDNSVVTVLGGPITIYRLLKVGLLSMISPSAFAERLKSNGKVKVNEDGTLEDPQGLLLGKLKSHFEVYEMPGIPDEHPVLAPNHACQRCQWIGVVSLFALIFCAWLGLFATTWYVCLETRSIALSKTCDSPARVTWVIDNANEVLDGATNVTRAEIVAEVGVSGVCNITSPQLDEASARAVFPTLTHSDQLTRPFDVFAHSQTYLFLFLGSCTFGILWILWVLWVLLVDEQEMPVPGIVATFFGVATVAVAATMVGLLSVDYPNISNFESHDSLYAWSEAATEFMLFCLLFNVAVPLGFATVFGIAIRIGLWCKERQPCGCCSDEKKTESTSETKAVEKVIDDRLVFKRYSKELVVSNEFELLSRINPYLNQGELRKWIERPYTTKKHVDYLLRNTVMTEDAKMKIVIKQTHRLVDWFIIMQVSIFFAAVFIGLNLTGDFETSDWRFYSLIASIAIVTIVTWYRNYIGYLSYKAEMFDGLVDKLRRSKEWLGITVKEQQTLRSASGTLDDDDDEHDDEDALQELTQKVREMEALLERLPVTLRRRVPVAEGARSPEVEEDDDDEKSTGGADGPVTASVELMKRPDSSSQHGDIV